VEVVEGNVDVVLVAVALSVELGLSSALGRLIISKERNTITKKATYLWLPSIPMAPRMAINTPRIPRTVMTRVSHQKFFTFLYQG